MKYKINISALLVALLVFVSTNGFIVFEHICNTSRNSDFSILAKTSCDNDKPLAACCAKMGIQKKKGCCENKQFFNKLSIEGFTAEKTKLVTPKAEVNNYFINSSTYKTSTITFESHYSGLPPPDNLFEIQFYLKPSPERLQVVLC